MTLYLTTLLVTYEGWMWKWLRFSVPVVGCFGGVCMPVIRAKMSNLVADDEQGKQRAKTTSVFCYLWTLELSWFSQWFNILMIFCFMLTYLQLIGNAANNQKIVPFFLWCNMFFFLYIRSPVFFGGHLGDTMHVVWGWNIQLVISSHWEAF